MAWGFGPMFENITIFNTSGHDWNNPKIWDPKPGRLPGGPCFGKTLQPENGPSKTNHDPRPESENVPPPLLLARHERLRSSGAWFGDFSGLEPPLCRR